MASRLATSLAAAVALACMTAPGAALAQPPQAGTVHTFLDPMSNSGTVFCDGFEHVNAIARANDPDGVYEFYRTTANALNEPVCMAIIPTGLVVDVVPLGVMTRNGRSYDAWAVETDIEGTTVFGLYVEQSGYVGV